MFGQQIKLWRITTKLTGVKSEKGISFEIRCYLANKFPAGKKRTCFWRPVERCVIHLDTD